MPTKGHCKTVTFGEVAAILIKVISWCSKAAKLCRRIPSTAPLVTKQQTENSYHENGKI